MAWAGGLALADGAAGIGKTRLLEAAGEQAAALGFQGLTARGSDLERQFAYGVVRQLFEAAVLDAGSGAATSPLRGPAAYAEPVFGSNPFPADASEAPDRSEAVLHGLYWLTSNLAESALS